MRKAVATLVLVSVMLALAACSGEDAAPSASDAPTSAAATPTPVPSPTEAAIMTMAEAGATVDEASVACYRVQDRLYKEFSAPTPSLTVVRHRAAKAGEACEGFRRVVDSTEWPTKLRADMTAYGKQLAVLAKQYARMSRSKNLEDAVAITRAISKKFDASVVRRLTQTLSAT